MELVLMVLLPFPLGYFLRNRLAAYVIYTAAHAFVFTFQTLTLFKAWIGGDRSAFTADPNAVEWSYGLVNVAIYAAGAGLVWLGHRLARRPRPSVDGVAAVHGDAFAGDDARGTSTRIGPRPDSTADTGPRPPMRR